VLETFRNLNTSRKKKKVFWLNIVIGLAMFLRRVASEGIFHHDEGELRIKA